VDTPKNGHPCFPKTRYPVFGTCLKNGHPLKTPKVFFRKQGTPFLGHASKTGPKWPQNGQNGHAWSHFRKIGFAFHQTINGVVFFAPKKFRKLPSAASSLHKSISSISFLDIDSCPFSQKFFDFCAKSNRKITNFKS
jgi:hypothetical protein